MPDQGIIVVTGGEGFLGSFIVKELLDRGHQVRVFAREKRSKLEPSARLSFYIGDIQKATDCTEACLGATGVIHTASVVHKGNLAAMEAINVGGTERILEAAVKAGVKQFILTSSVSVVDEGHHIRGVDESTPMAAKPLNEYCGSKGRAETLALAWNGRGGMAVCALRPALLYGAGDRVFLPSLVAFYRTSQSRTYFSDRSTRMEFSYVENVAYAHALAIEQLSLGASFAGKPLNISDGEPTNLFKFANRIFEAAGYPGHFAYRFPTWIVFAMAYTITFLYSLVGLESPVLVSDLRHLITDHYFDVSAARKHLGYEPRVLDEERIARTALWLKGELER